ncbi:lineage-specific thermal regulator protein [Limihaloglobus sulfuriphilus]|uniref:Lineage-specific thermal regulator protein n=1 Tax=Limihaloglobus sulfuriphilus TaxID=1851148 RepID=A0A1Q2MHB2_9BACT|nr:PadR family transcriptional regulator [Limihaloglobus sulfuriphilus]AQQ72095.1 lineage-specific thermal regulator protein [Limihaloglobus sulfuriphilus]
MKLENQLLKGRAPKVVLEILSRGKMCGYELSKALSKCGNILSLGKGILYPLLYTLEAKKLINANWQTAANGRKRRYYSITSKGKAYLAEHKQSIDHLRTGLDSVSGTAEYPT